MSRYVIHPNGQRSSTKSSATMGFNPDMITTPAKIISKKPIANIKELPKGNYYVNVPSSSIMDKLNKTVGIYDDSISNQVYRYTTQYNRFKLPNVDEAFNRGYAHVFFVKPDCNIINGGGGNMYNYSLATGVANDPDFLYMYKTEKPLLTELTTSAGQSHDFMLSLSNHVASFSLNDEGIATDSYGQNLIGYKIQYGKHDAEFKTAGEFTVDINDDKELNLYKLNRLWVQYIAKVYRGTLSPKPDYIRNKILDYASACYYIITAEDGETIIFWSKFFGVFPKTIPSGQYAWSNGSVLNADSIKMQITYAYSFKEDCNPDSLSDFNKNAHATSNCFYVPTFDSSLGHSGKTWVGCPYIEYDNSGSGSCYKLRFKQN